METGDPESSTTPPPGPTNMGNETGLKRIVCCWFCLRLDVTVDEGEGVLVELTPLPLPPPLPDPILEA